MVLKKMLFPVVLAFAVLLNGVAQTPDVARYVNPYIGTGDHAGTGFMHESFNKDNPADFSRSWFAWANTLFGELLLKIGKEHPELLQQQY